MSLHRDTYGICYTGVDEETAPLTDADGAG